jgi:hypothetical protein
MVEGDWDIKLVYGLEWILLILLDLKFYEVLLSTFMINYEWYLIGYVIKWMIKICINII